MTPGRSNTSAPEATVDEHKVNNIHVKDGTKREDLIERRQKRAATLSLPNRFLPALQVNLRGGWLPPAEDDGNH